MVHTAGEHCNQHSRSAFLPPPGLEHEVGANLSAVDLSCYPMKVLLGDGLKAAPSLWKSDTAGRPGAFAGPPGVFLPRQDAHPSKVGAKHGNVMRSKTGRDADDNIKAAATTTLSVPSELLRRLGAEPMEVSLYEVLPCLAAVAKDQEGCKFLQTHLPEASKEVQAMICGASLPEIVGLSMEEFGHVFVVQLLDISTAEQRNVIARKLSSQMKVLSLDQHGCHVVQRALQVVSPSSREQLINGLADCVGECIMNRHGNHVIQVCIQQAPAASVSFIVDAIQAQGADTVSAHVYGCRIIVRLFEHLQSQEMGGVLRQVFDSIPKLLKDRYGNYVLQHILQHGNVNDRKQIISEILKSDVLSLAKHIYAHRVVEKCIEVVFSPSFEASLLDEQFALSHVFLHEEVGQTVPAVSLASNKRGMLIVQCLLNHLDGDDLEKLEQALVQK